MTSLAHKVIRNGNHLCLLGQLAYFIQLLVLACSLWYIFCVALSSLVLIAPNEGEASTTALERLFNNPFDFTLSFRLGYPVNNSCYDNILSQCSFGYREDCILPLLVKGTILMVQNSNFQGATLNFINTYFEGQLQPTTSS